MMAAPALLARRLPPPPAKESQPLSRESRPALTIRDAEPRDFAAVLALNHAWEHFTSPLDDLLLERLLSHAAYHRVAESAGQVVAFLIAVEPGTGHDSVNYRWFDSRSDGFLYIDRIVVDEQAQRLGCGRALYRDVEAFARSRRIRRLVCEVDAEPLNEVSDAFHERFGFVEVGTQRVPPKDKQVSLREYVIPS
jgi:predicted GNAT superfamily acetyltransferase